MKPDTKESHGHRWRHWAAEALHRLATACALSTWAQQGARGAAGVEYAELARWWLREDVTPCCRRGAPTLAVPAGAAANLGCCCPA